jgi:hypothetical protein
LSSEGWLMEMNLDFFCQWLPAANHGAPVLPLRQSLPLENPLSKKSNPTIEFFGGREKKRKKLEIR